MPRYRHRGVVQDYEGNFIVGAEISVFLQSPRNFQVGVDTSTGTLSGTYYYAVQSLKSETYSQLSQVKSVSVTGTAILSWAEDPGSTNYRVWRGTSSDSLTEYVDVTATSLSDDGTLTWTTGSPQIDGAKIFTSEFATTPVTTTPQLTSGNGGFYEFWIDTGVYHYLTRYVVEAVYGPATFVEDDIIISWLADNSARLGNLDWTFYFNSLFGGSPFIDYYQEFTYDSNGNVTQVAIYKDSTKSEQIGTVVMSYDSNGNVASMTATFDGESVTATFTYDTAGNVASIECIKA